MLNYTYKFSVGDLVVMDRRYVNAGKVKFKSCLLNVRLLKALVVISVCLDTQQRKRSNIKISVVFQEKNYCVITGHSLLQVNADVFLICFTVKGNYN